VQFHEDVHASKPGDLLGGNCITNGPGIESGTPDIVAVEAERLIAQQ
jgi:hypothetical protein